MSILPSQTNITLGDSWYVKVVGASTVNADQFIGKEIDSLKISTGVLNVGTINVAGGISTSGGDITAVNVFAQNVTATDTMTSYFNNTQYITSYQGGNIHSLLITSNIGGTGTLYYPQAIISTVSTAHIILDGNTLDTAGVGLGAALLLNGQPIATASSLTSSILTWSFWPSISTVQMSGNDLLGAATVQGDTANFYDLNAVNQITFGTNLYGATGNLNLLNTNSISTALLITASTATKYISTGSIDVTTISASNIYASNSIYASNVTASNISMNTGGSIFSDNASIVNLSVTNSANFSGNRPNFTTGINATGANNFNNGSLDNVPNINTQGSRSMTINSANGLDLNAPTRIQLLCDGGSNIGGYASVNLLGRNGNRGQINLTADPGYINVGTQVQGEVNITANGGGALTAYATGGVVNITANTGSSPVLGTLSYSAIKLNAAGITSYAGFASPLVAVPGYNLIQGSLGIELVAGSVPVLPNVPGTVYLYGATGVAQQTGGIRVQNGMSIDFLVPYATGNVTPPYDLIISGNPAGNKVQITNVRTLSSDQGTASGFTSITSGSLTGNNVIVNTGSVLGLTGTEQLINFNLVSSALTTASTATFNTAKINNLSSGSATIYNLIGISTINGYTVDQLVSTVTPPQFYSTVSTFQQLFTSSLVASNIYAAQGVFSSLTGVSTIDGYTIAQFVSSVSPQAPAPSTFQQLYTSSFVASNISSQVINASSILLNGVALSPPTPQISSFSTLQTSTLQANQISTNIFTFSTINGYNINQLVNQPLISTFSNIYVSDAGILNQTSLVLVVSSINGYNTDQFLSSPAAQIQISSFQEFFVSSLQTNAISTQKLQASDLSTQTLEVSSINGLQLSQLVNPTLSTISTFQQLYTSSFQANTISTGSAFIYSLTGVSSIDGYSISQLVSSVAPQPPIPSTVQQFYTSSLAVNAIIPYQTGTVTVASDLIALQANTSVTITANTCNVTLDGNTIITDSTTDTTQIVGNNWTVTAGCNASINSSNTMSIYNTNTAPPVNPNDLYIIGQGVTTLAGQTSLNLIGQTTVALTAPTSVTITTPSTVCSADLNVKTINGQIPVFGFVDPISTFTNLYATNLFNNPASPDLTLTAAATLIENAGNIIRNADYAITDSALEYTLYTDTSSYIRANSTFTVSAQDKVLIDATDSINFSTPTLLWNGAPIGGGWVSTATTQLNMNSYPITDLTGNLTLSTIGSINLNCDVAGSNIVVAPVAWATGQSFPQPGTGHYQFLTNNSGIIPWDYVLLTDSYANVYWNAPWDAGQSLNFPITATLASGAYYDLKITYPAGDVSEYVVTNTSGVVTFGVVTPTTADFTWGQGRNDSVPPSGQINLFATQTNVTAASTVNLIAPAINLNAVSTIGLAATSNIQLSASRVGLSGVNGQQTLILENTTASLTNSTGDVTIEANSALNLIADNGNAQIYATNGNLNLAASNYVRIYGATIELSNVSSINGVPYTGGGSSWVGTAASDLDMNGYNIGTTAGSNLTVASSSQSLEFNQGSSVTTLSNGPGHIDIRAPSGNINLLASNTVYAGGAQYNTSNIGNSLGTFVPFRGYYEPPTGAGQAIELQIEGHAADAGARFLLTYGCDINSGTSYLIGSWPGYILTPLTCYGQSVTLDATESVYLTAGSGNITQTATAAINLVAGGDINIQGAHIALSNLSSINGVPYTGGGSTWVGTATSDLDMNGYNIGTASGSNLSIISSSNLTLATGGQSLVFNQGSLVATLSNGVGSVDIIAPTTTINSGNINLLGDIYLNNHNLYSVAYQDFTHGGNINSVYDSGINYLTISAPSGTGKLRLFGNNGNLIFDDNVGLAGNGSNQVGLYNQYGYMYLAPNQNVYIGGGGSHTIGEDQIIVHGLIYSDSRIYTNASGQGFYHQNSNAFIKTECLYGTYGSLSLNGYLTVCEAGTTSEIFRVPADNNQPAWYNNGTGGFGIGTTTPSARLDVSGEAKISGYLSIGYGSTTSPLYMNGNTTYQQGGIIDLGATSSNNAYISGLNHIYGQPSGTGSYFGGLIIDYMGGMFFNGGGNTGSVYVTASDHVLHINNGADIVIDATTHGLNIYGAGMNINTTLNMNSSNIYNIGSIQNNTSRLDINMSNGLKLTDVGTGGTGTFTVDSANHLYWNGTLIA